MSFSPGHVSRVNHFDNCRYSNQQKMPRETKQLDSKIELQRAKMAEKHERRQQLGAVEMPVHNVQFIPLLRQANVETPLHNGVVLNVNKLDSMVFMLIAMLRGNPTVFIFGISGAIVSKGLN